MWMIWKKPEPKQFFHVLIFMPIWGGGGECIATQMQVAVVQAGNISVPCSGPVLPVLLLVMSVCAGGSWAEQEGAISTSSFVLFLI